MWLSDFFISQVTDTLATQDRLVPRIEGANAQFEQEMAGASAGARETMLKDLAAAYDTFTELVANLTEGTRVRNCFFSDGSMQSL